MLILSKAAKRLDPLKRTKANDELEGIVGALILLLSDISEADQVHALRKALPELMIGPDKPMGPVLRNIIATSVAALDICDGSSGIGALGAKTLNAHLRAIRNEAKRLEALTTSR